MNTGDPYNNQTLPPLSGGNPQDPSQNQQQYSAYQGSPESAPVPLNVESPVAQPEYGNEALKRIEQQPESIEAAERKDVRQPSQQPQQNKPVVQPAKLPAITPPKFFGYNVPPKIASNYALIRSQKGKGDPEQARTWLYVFLDRLLKKQTYHN